jgi:acyl-CoA synthetase (AMP-forming)/AMP-acid ligase II
LTVAITDLFDRGWRSNPAKAAFIAGDRSYSYTEIGELSCQVGNSLLARQIKPEVTGAVLAGNDPQAWACVLGMWRAGLAWVPVNPAYSVDEIQRLLGGFDCEVLFFQEQFLPVVDKIPRGPAEPADPDLARHGWRRRSDDRATTLDALIDGASSAQPDFIPAADAVAGVVPTGGTTGAPKAR